MPNSKAKDRKQKRYKLNAKWKIEGRTKKQNKKWKKKMKSSQNKNFRSRA